MTKTQSTGAKTHNHLQVNMLVYKQIILISLCYLKNIIIWYTKQILKQRKKKKNSFHNTQYRSSAWWQPRCEVVYTPTRMQSLFCVPNCNAIPMQILLPWSVNFKLHMHLPVFQVTGLQRRERHQTVGDTIYLCNVSNNERYLLFLVLGITV